jgi:hypothetical protein
MKTNNISKFFTGSILTGMILLALLGISAIQVNAQTRVEGNPTCMDLGFTNGFKIDPPRAGTFNLPNGGQVMVSIDSNERITFQATGNIIHAVIVKGGPNANVYRYNSGVTTAGHLTTPVNPDSVGNKNYGLSHFDFCYEKVSFIPTASTAMLAGRVTANTGNVRGSSRLIVTILNTNTMETQDVFTNRLGFYEFNDLPVGDTYVISVRGKGYSFNPQTFTLLEDSAFDMFGAAVGRSIQ